MRRPSLPGSRTGRWPSNLVGGMQLQHFVCIALAAILSSICCLLILRLFVDTTGCGAEGGGSAWRERCTSIFIVPGLLCNDHPCRCSGPATGGCVPSNALCASKPGPFCIPLSSWAVRPPFCAHLHDSTCFHGQRRPGGPSRNSGRGTREEGAPLLAGARIGKRVVLGYPNTLGKSLLSKVEFVKS